MGTYNFEHDLKTANNTEKQIKELLESLGYLFVEYCHNNKYDIVMTNKQGEKNTFEVKEDFACERTGNVGVEYECRGKPSGIASSVADFYIYKIHEPSSETKAYCIRTAKLKKLIEDDMFFRTVSGGDVGSNTKCYLFKLKVIKDNFELLGNI